MIVISDIVHDIGHAEKSLLPTVDTRFQSAHIDIVMQDNIPQSPVETIVPA